MFVRISYMHPKSGNEARVREILQELSSFYHSQPGYQSGYLLDPYEGARSAATRLGRVGIWDSEDAAEHAGQQEHSMALRAELTRIVEEDSHTELTFFGRPDQG